MKNIFLTSLICLTSSLNAEMRPMLEEELTGFKRSFLRLNEFLSWEPVRLVEKGDIISVKVEGRLSRDRNQYELIEIPAYYLEPVSIEERIEKIGHVSMQWGIYSWQCPAWLRPQGSFENSLHFIIHSARKGQPLLLNYIAIAGKTEVIDPLPALNPPVVDQKTVEIQFPEMEKAPAGEFIYKYDVAGNMTMIQKGTENAMRLDFYTPTQAIGKGKWTIDGNEQESSEIRVNFLSKK